QRERKADRIEVGIAARRGKPLDEAAARAAGDVDHEAVEDAAAAFVGVEALIEEVAQHPPALRLAERDRRRDVEIGEASGAGRRGVAHGGEPEAGYERILRLEDDVVDLAGFQSFVGEQPSAILGEAPAVSRHRGCGRVRIVANEQDVPGAFALERRVELRAGGPPGAAVARRGGGAAPHAGRAPRARAPRPPPAARYPPGRPAAPPPPP